MRGFVAVLWMILLAGWMLGGSSAAQALSSGFIENRGQVDESVRYYLPGSGAAIYFTLQAVVVALNERIEPPAGAWDAPGRWHHPSPADSGSDSQPRRGCVVHVRFEGANASPRIEARSELATRYNYFLGDDPVKWRSEVPAYAEVVYRDVWPGVDLVFREERGALSYEASIRGGADAGAVAFDYEGAQGVRSEGAGIERVETSVGSLVHQRSGLSGEFRWEEPAQEPGLGESPSPMEDPEALLWSTFLGGFGADRGDAMDLDPSGNPILAGLATGGFPTTPGAYDTTYNFGYDAFVAKLDASGSSLSWCTYLGGDGWDEVLAVRLDPSGNVIVTGVTNSTAFPTTAGAYDTSHNGDGDVFLTKLSPSGSALLWSTYLGGGAYDAAFALALDSSNNLLLTGMTQSTDFPTTLGAYDRTQNGGADVFVAKMSSSGNTLQWSTFIGGSGTYIYGEYGYALVLDSSRNVVVTGFTQDADFPVTAGAYDVSYNGVRDAFLLKLGSTGSTLIWSTFLGGTGGDTGCGVALDSAGQPLVTGSADAGFPTTPGAYDTSFNGAGDAFVAKLNSTGSSLLWSTYFGGATGGEYGWALTLDTCDRPVFVGPTNSTDFPTTSDAYDQTYNGGDCDGFACKLNADGTALLWGSYLGGSDYDKAYGMDLDSSGDVVVTGDTRSSNFPTTPGAYDRSYNGGTLIAGDAFVSRLNLPARTWRILPDGTGDAPTIQAGIDQACPAETVLVACGTYYEHDIEMKAGVTLMSETGDPTCVTVDAQRLGRVLSCLSRGGTTRIEGITLTGGLAADGAGLYCDHADPTLVRCVLAGNAAGETGGGASVVDCALPPTFLDCIFSQNRAVKGGGIYVRDANIRLTGCTFGHNLASGLGGGICSEGQITFNLEHVIIAFSALGAAIYHENYQDPPILHCCDLFGNAGGDWIFPIEDQYDVNGNICRDPRFCGGQAPDDPYSLEASSPCAAENNPECGQIGARPVGCLATGVEVTEGLPSHGGIRDLVPNPSAGAVLIRYEIPQAAPVVLRVYDVCGRLVRRLVEGSFAAGPHAAFWDGKDDRGMDALPGLYFYRLEVAGQAETLKGLLVR